VLCAPRWGERLRLPHARGATKHEIVHAAL